jgi:hypothetical protein
MEAAGRTHGPSEDEPEEDVAPYPGWVLMACCGLSGAASGALLAVIILCVRRFILRA